MLFSIEIRSLDGIKVAELAGRLTIGKQVTDVEDQLKQLVSERPVGIIVDMAGVELIDSAGVGSVITVISSARAQGVPLRIAGCKEKIRHVFDLTQVTQLVEMLPDVETAVASLGQASGA